MKKELYLTHRPLADMHGDGVRFNEQLLKKAKQHPQTLRQDNRAAGNSSVSREN